VVYVVIFRQLSIPLGAILGVTLLREPSYPAKYFAVALMFAGLLLTALG
jgi:drug/metabolite transporter (DMT)-like permease